MARIRIDEDIEPLEIVIGGKVFQATRLADLPISKAREIQRIVGALETDDEEARHAAMLEYIGKLVPGFTAQVMDGITARQLNKLVTALGEDLKATS